MTPDAPADAPDDLTPDAPRARVLAAIAAVKAQHQRGARGRLWLELGEALWRVRETWVPTEDEPSFWTWAKHLPRPDRRDPAEGTYRRLKWVNKVVLRYGLVRRLPLVVEALKENRIGWAVAADASAVVLKGETRAAIVAHHIGTSRIDPDEADRLALETLGQHALKLARHPESVRPDRSTVPKAIPDVTPATRAMLRNACVQAIAVTDWHVTLPEELVLDEQLALIADALDRLIQTIRAGDIKSARAMARPRT